MSPSACQAGKLMSLQPLFVGALNELPVVPETHTQAHDAYTHTYTYTRDMPMVQYQRTTQSENSATTTASKAAKTSSGDEARGSRKAEARQQKRAWVPRKAWKRTWVRIDCFGDWAEASPCLLACAFG